MCVYPVPALCNSTDTSGRLDIYRLCGLRGPMSLSVQVLETVTARAFFGQVSSGFDPLSLCRCSKPIGAVRAPVSRDWLTFQRCIRGLAAGTGLRLCAYGFSLPKPATLRSKLHAWRRIRQYLRFRSSPHSVRTYTLKRTLKHTEKQPE